MQLFTLSFRSLLRCALLLGVSIGGCAALPEAPPKRSPLLAQVSFDQYPARIPFKRTVDDLPIVLAETGHGKLWMLVDTGCDTVVLTPRTAKRMQMKLVPMPFYSSDAGGNHRRIDGVAPVDRLSLGPAHFFNFYTVVNDMGFISEQSHPLGGIAGLALFSDTLLTIDYSQNQIILEPGALPPPDGKEILPAMLSKGKLWVQMELGDRVQWLMVDSGYSGHVIIPREQKTLFAGSEKKLAVANVQCFYGNEQVDVAQLSDDLRIGWHTIQQPTVEVGTAPTAMIGSQFLKHFIVTIDLQNERVRFATPGNRPIFVPAEGRETEHEIALLNRLMNRPATRPSSSATQPSAGIDPEDLRL